MTNVTLLEDLFDQCVYCDGLIRIIWGGTVGWDGWWKGLFKPRFLALGMRSSTVDIAWFALQPYQESLASFVSCIS